MSLGNVQCYRQNNSDFLNELAILCINMLTLLVIVILIFTGTSLVLCSVNFAEFTVNNIL